MKATEQDVRDYCRKNGYDYDRLMAVLDENDRAELYPEVQAVINGDNLLDGFFAEVRYEWRNAMLIED